ncbi:gst2 Glutathione S-transferase 2 [Candida maltosa Xu316]|uniref:Putative glutathione S-transferase n=1 Tax=Candida maltosa (strain Xu316) TaxID=1245528 RepID=M3J9N2_CANMX|nr:putative glutathione S-transferase [Candida maltosa Xu316]
MTITLYTAPTGNGRKPLIFLKLLNIPHNVHMFSWPAGDQLKQEWYLKLNPHAIIPTLVDGDLVLPESNAILSYLADTYDIEGKFSYKKESEPEKYWQSQKWIFYQATQFAGTLFRFNTFIGLKKPEEDDVIWKNILENFEKVYRVVNDHLKDREFFVGDKFTFVDLAFAVGHFRRIECAGKFGYEDWFKDYEEKYPYLIKWYDRVLQVPGFKEGLELK